MPAPYEDTAIQSIVTGVDSARARSAITITAPLSTPTISRSLPAYSASIFAASSVSLASISSLVMSTFSRSAPMSFASTRITFGRPTGRSGPPRDPCGRWGPDSALPNHQSATLTTGDDPAGEIDGPLTAPAGDQPVDLLDVPGEQRTGRCAGLDGGPAQHPAAHGGRQVVQRGALQAAVGVPDAGRGLPGPGVEGVGVVTGELGRTGEGLDDALAEGLLQGGQALVAQPGAV